MKMTGTLIFFSSFIFLYVEDSDVKQLESPDDPQGLYFKKGFSLPQFTNLPLGLLPFLTRSIKKDTIPPSHSPPTITKHTH